MTDKRDLLLALAFIKFIGDHFNAHRQQIAEEVKARGIDDEDFINRQYLYILFSRPEFDKYARWKFWGSARETCTWDDMQRLQNSLPPT